jgi:hypothetical protein
MALGNLPKGQDAAQFVGLYPQNMPVTPGRLLPVTGRRGFVCPALPVGARQRSDSAQTRRSRQIIRVRGKCLTANIVGLMILATALIAMNYERIDRTPGQKQRQ